jgi:hypothetical protein
MGRIGSTRDPFGSSQVKEIMTNFKQFGLNQIKKNNKVLMIRPDIIH